MCDKLSFFNYVFSIFSTHYLKESFPRQVDKKSGILRRRKGSGILKEEEMTNIFFSLHSLVLVT